MESCNTLNRLLSASPKEIDIDKVKEKGYGLVRRQTGGRGVLHDKELTYSVIVPESHPNMPSTVTEAYKIISQGLLEGFKNLGFETYFAIPVLKKKRQIKATTKFSMF